MLQPLFNCPYPLDQSYLSPSCHSPSLCVLPACISLLQQLLIAPDFPYRKGGFHTTFLLVPKPNACCATWLAFGRLSRSFIPKQPCHGWVQRLQLGCHEHMPGAGEHKRMEISMAFVSAIEVMMTIHCCRCVHIQYVFFII